MGHGRRVTGPGMEAMGHRGQGQGAKPACKRQRRRRSLPTGTDAQTSPAAPGTSGVCRNDAAGGHAGHGGDAGQPGPVAVTGRGVHAGLCPPWVAAGDCGTAAGGQETHPNSPQSPNTLKNTEPQAPPSPAAAIRVGDRAGTRLSPPPQRVRGVCWQRGPKSGQTLRQEPPTVVTSLILGVGWIFSTIESLLQWVSPCNLPELGWGNLVGRTGKLDGILRLLRQKCPPTPRPRPQQVGVRLAQTPCFFRNQFDARKAKRELFGHRPPECSGHTWGQSDPPSCPVAAPGDTPPPCPPVGGPRESPPSRLPKPRVPGRG